MSAEQGNNQTPYIDSPILIGQSGPLNGERWEINRDLILGRDEACEVLIPDRQVSRYHARIEMKDENVYLEDLGSKNGTYINGEAVQGERLLQDGDVIQIAMIQNFVYLSSDATMPLGPGLGPSLEMVTVASEDTPHLLIDKRSRRVFINEQEILPPLSVPQFRLLEALFDNHGRVVSRQELVVAVWGDKEAVGVSEQALDALVRRLRDRLAEIDPKHNFLVTVRGYGIRLED